MLKQFNNYSSWREKDITVEPYKVGTMDFHAENTTPNIFVVQNPNKALIKVGITKMPTSNSYEYQIEKNCTESVGRPIGTKQIYFYNDSDSKVTLKVFSLEGEFDLALLHNVTVNLDGLDLNETNFNIGGFKEGSQLPSGSNEIGVVRLNFTQINSILTKIGEAVESNDSMKTVLNTINSNMATHSENEVSKVGEVLTKLETIEELLTEKEFTYGTLLEIDGYTFTGKGTLYIDSLINDGDTDIIIHVDNHVYWILKTGEFINDMCIKGNIVTVDGGLFRMAYHY